MYKSTKVQTFLLKIIKRFKYFNIVKPIILQSIHLSEYFYNFRVRFLQEKNGLLFFFLESLIKRPFEDLYL